MPDDFNRKVIEEFRANAGRVGGPFEGARLLLLTTTGARSGAPHTVPVGYLPDGGEQVLVIASAGGAPHHPAWFRNLVAHPRVTVEDGVFTYEAQAVVLEGAERDHAFARAAEAEPGWAGYQAATSRTIPVVALKEVAGGPPNAASWGAALRMVHGAFRRELALIRDETAAAPGLRVGAQLRINCLTLCRGLEHHHTSEDGAMFPALARSRPDLAPVLERLDREHREIAALLGEMQRLLADEEADAGRLAEEVRRLTGELEEHLDYEEEQLIPVLDAPAS